MTADKQAQKCTTADWTEVTQLLASLRQEVARLAGRVAALEAVAGGAGRGAEKKEEAPVATPNLGVDEELLVVISAAIAAFLGKRPHIRQIRLAGTPTWAQQGRVTIQASHALAVAHARSER